MTTKLLSSLVQTRSIELVLAPLAAQVSQLIILNEVGERDGIPVPNLVSHANEICESIRSLVLAAENLVSESTDDEFKAAMPEACSEVTQSGQALHMASHKLNQESFSHAVRYSLVDSARNILEGTMKVLLVYDQNEVRKIIRAVHWVMDRLGFTEAVTSMRGFIISFKAFTESLMLLASLCDKRQRELSNTWQRDRILSAMAILKKSVGLLSSTMQVYLRQPANHQAKASRDYVVGQIKLACTEIIRAVEATEEINQHSGCLADTLKKAHHELRQPHAWSDSTNQLDCYLDAIIRSSMAIANTVEGAKREKIVTASQLVLQTRNELSESQKAIMSNSNGLKERRNLDTTVNRLTSELKRLDHNVTLAIVDQISSVFTCAELPIHNLVTTATKHPRGIGAIGQQEATIETKHKADMFVSHANKLIQVSRHAASISSNPPKVHIITCTCSELEKLIPQLVAAAGSVRRDPRDIGTVDRLCVLRRDWAEKLVTLTDAVDDVTNIQDFIDISELHVQRDVARCHEALAEGNAAKLAQVSHGLHGRVERISQVCKREIAKTSDPNQQDQLERLCLDIDQALSSLGLTVEEMICDVSDSSHHAQVTQAMRITMQKIQAMKTAVSGTKSAALKGSEDLTQPSPSQHMKVSWEQFKSGSDKLSSDGNEGLVTSGVDTSSPFDRLTYQNKSSSLPFKNPSTAEQPRYLQQLERKHVSSTWESLHSKGDGEGMDQPALLGLVPSDSQSMTSLASIRGHPVTPSRRSGVHVTRLIRATKTGDRRQVEARVTKMATRVQGSTHLAEKAAEKCIDPEKVRQARVTSSELRKLMPMIIQAARDVTANPNDVMGVDRLHTIGREWACKLHILESFVDDLVFPWSASASKLALSATSGDPKEVRKQISNIKDHITRLRQLAVSAKTAADAEDYAVDAGNEFNVTPVRDPASIKRVELLQLTSRDVEEITERLIAAAQEMVLEPTDVEKIERLEAFRRKWAFKVKKLILAVDDVTVGTSAPVEPLAFAAIAGDQHALQERARLLTSYVRTLKEMGGAATKGCRDDVKVTQVTNSVAAVERITADLHDTARVVVNLRTPDHKTTEQDLALMSIEEKMSLSQREWATKVHLLTALVDDLTADVSAPVDRLAGAALAISKAEPSAHARQEREFDAQAQELLSRVVRMSGSASKAVQHSGYASKVRTVRVTGDFIDRLTPQVVAAARALLVKPDQSTVEHFQMIRRQWASKAQLLMATLEEMPDADHAAVQSVIRDLLGSQALDTAASFESLTEDESAAITGSTRLFNPSPLPDQVPARLTKHNHSPSQSRDQVPARFTRHIRSPSPSRDPVPTRFTKSVPVRTSFPTWNPVPSRTADPKISPSTRKRTLSKRPVNEPAVTDSASSRVSLDDMVLERKLERSVSDSEALPDSHRRVPIGASSSETDIRKALVAELNQRFSSSESLNRSKWDARYWAKFETERKKHQRAASMTNLRRAAPDWKSDSTEDLRAQKSSKSIALAAHILQDEAEQWDEENNSIVQVAKMMAQQMLQIARLARQRGRLQNKMGMINTSKAIAENGKVILKFAHVLANQCVDERRTPCWCAMRRTSCRLS
ncbi:uncharacterized protein LOC116618752 isoform X2 [Nematostella vectensis]|uniref:uncharacterized protein LOC116618752 isoform X2 n=1 Tax=Nematostella vectensis TaxID=45351 RepID=UPI002076E5D9|nr:uncharacterized protein LOC116618752 isoform X2 [Nematostella vectensis]